MKGGDFGAEGLNPDISLGHGLGAQHEGAVLALLHDSVVRHLDTLHVALIGLRDGHKQASAGSIVCHFQRTAVAINQSLSFVYIGQTCNLGHAGNGE